MKKQNSLKLWRQSLCCLAQVLLGVVLMQAGSRPAAAQPLNSYVLAGPTPASAFGVDDDLTVYLNGLVIYQDSDKFSTLTPPIHFSAKPGDLLRVVAINAQGCEWIDPFFLHLTHPPTGPTTTKLLSAGIPPNGVCTYPAGPFFDQTFTIPAEESAGNGEPNSAHLRISGGGDQATLSVGQCVTLELSVRFVGHEAFADVTAHPNTSYSTDPAHGSFSDNVFCARAGDENKTFTLYGRYRDPKTRVTVVDTVIIHVRR